MSPIGKTTLIAGTAMVVVAILVGTSLSQDSEPPKASAVQWEYLTFRVSHLNQGDLNNRGKDGWELVDFEANREPTTGYGYVFKRQVR
ncbi:hypothetical protein OAS39_00035 [Pirellulales bacterium]|nr:hypothetical protein [Pirellulales bacterium]